jgi:hypothetical protein
MAGITLSPAERDLSRIVLAVRQLTEGRSNAVGSVTLTPDTGTPVTSTAVAAPNCGPGSAVLLFPQTANAAAALGTTYVPAADVAAGIFTIRHASAATTDRTFHFVCLG